MRSKRKPRSNRVASNDWLGTAKKKKRKLLGVGHPYFFTAPSDNAQGRFSALMLLDKDRGYPKTISTCGVGGWKKVRVYLEWY